MMWSPAFVELGTYGSGADCRPSSFYQFWLWVEIFMRNGEKFFMVGLAAICWAWRARKLQAAQDHPGLEAGAEALKGAALVFHPPESTSEDTGMVLLR
ncbi:hypothetical protein GQ55_2G242800 [Panicum hallii var. hallii]|uniref:Uncharacterized protein n=1 Tax=Panicum hallii var. hallii TaxID=1504633 RepID=A0A2T7ERX2_9POAL|nr:hypothetical protein GQ55_2G242800 [Panicum hallii var. hallii]